MKRIISSLIVFVLLITLAPLSQAAVVKKNKLVETSRTTHSIYFDLIPAASEVITRVRIIQVKASSPEEADDQLARGKETVYYKRRTSPIRMTGLIPGNDYCFKGNFIAAKEFKGGYYATNENQDWNPDRETEWLCTGAEEDTTPTTNESQDVSVEKYENDLLIQNIEINSGIEQKLVGNSKVAGHWMHITLYNAGKSTIDGQKEIAVTCVDKAPTSELNTVVRAIGKDMSSGESFKLGAFITRKMALNCRSAFEIKLPTDDILFNNMQRVRFQSNSNGSYFIQQY